MLNISQIQDQYPPYLRPFKRSLLREYLQCKILGIIFSLPISQKLSFLGGTALRIIYENTRFSEDIDFDNFGLQDGDFEALAQKVRAGLESEGFIVEVDTIHKGAYRCRVKFPNVLFDQQLSPYHEEKILIRIDSASHHFEYQPDRKILNKFDVYSQIFVTPAPILLSQKICAALGRKRPKGRDFYDIVFLLSFTKPNYSYLEVKLGVSHPEPLRKKLLEATAHFDFQELARDVQDFLFNPRDSQKVLLFRNFIEQTKL